MKKLYLLILLLLGTLSSFAQDRNISGVVTDANSEPLIGANVVVKGTTIGTITDLDGSYSLVLPSKYTTLVVSYVGYLEQEVTVGASNQVNVVLEEDAIGLSEVVITALGTERNAREVVYANQTVSSDELLTTPNKNTIEALRGKTAGVKITTGSGSVGASSRIVLRGEASLTGNNNALIVVDGIAIDNDASVGGAKEGEGGYSDYGNRFNDLNPEDIESVTILKGPSATSLYGSRGASGVVLITTKRGKKGKPQVNFNHTTSVEQAYVLLKRQDKYGQGLINPDGSNSLDSGENFSWGPEFDGVVRPWTSPVDADGDGTLEYLSRPYSAVEDQLTNFFRLGRTNVNSVSISGGNDLLTYRVSYGNTYQRGILENTDYNRHNFGVGASAKLSDRLSSNFNVSYSTINQNTAQEGSRAFEGQNPYASAIQGPVNIPYNEVRDYNNPFHGFDGYYGSYTVNPYFVLNEYRNEGNINNFLANMFINYELFKGVNLNTRIGTNLVGTVIEEVTPIYAYSDHYYWGDNLTLISRSDRQSSAGAYERFNKNSKTIDWTTKVDFERFVDKDERLNLGISLGFNYWDLNIRRDQLRTQGGLSVPGVYNLANSVNPSLATQNDLRRRMVGLLGHVSLGLDNTFFLEYSARNDRSSTLPKENMDFFYHAIGASAVLTESLNLDDNILNYLKVRGSWGTSGKDADPYLLESVYFSNPVAIEYNDIYSIQFPLDGQPATTTGRAIGNPNLKPELTQTFEIGADVGFFDDRIVLEYTYYNSNHKDQIVNVSLASTSGFGQTAQNVGRITNKGHELGLFLKPIYRRNGFKWNVDLTFSKNKNEVVKISDDLDELVIWSSGRGVTLVAEEGQPFGVFKGQAPKYDPNGNPIVNSNGTLAYTEETVALGSVQPDWIAGLGTSFGYKNLSLGFLFDFKKGNEIFSLTKSATEFNGTAITTLLEDRKPFVLANSVQEILDEESGEVVGYEANTKATLADAFLFDGNYSRNVLDGSFAKLREITLTYDLPARTVAKMKVEGISVGLFAKNVKFWLPEENSFGDPEVNGPQESQTNVQGIETTQTPPSRSFGINLNINF